MRQQAVLILHIFVNVSLFQWKIKLGQFRKFPCCLNFQSFAFCLLNFRVIHCCNCVKCVLAGWGRKTSAPLQGTWDSHEREQSKISSSNLTYIGNFAFISWKRKEKRKESDKHQTGDHCMKWPTPTIFSTLAYLLHLCDLFDVTSSISFIEIQFSCSLPA